MNPTTTQSPLQTIDADLQWFSEADLRQFANQYVAIVDRAVVSHGDDPEVVYDDAKRRTTGAIHVFKVPATEVMVLIIT